MPIPSAGPDPQDWEDLRHIHDSGPCHDTLLTDRRGRTLAKLARKYIHKIPREWRNDWDDATSALWQVLAHLNDRFPHPIDLEESPGMFFDIAQFTVKTEWPHLHNAYISKVRREAAMERWRPGGFDPNEVRDQSIYKDVIGGEQVTKVAARHDLSRKQVYRILKRIDPDWRKVKRVALLDAAEGRPELKTTEMPKASSGGPSFWSSEKV